MIKGKSHKESHVAPTKYGMGDYYGSGIKQKVGRIRDDYISKPISSSKLGKPPKSLA